MDLGTQVKIGSRMIGLPTATQLQQQIILFRRGIDETALAAGLARDHDVDCRGDHAAVGSG
jgi:hypothetical protein